MCNVCRDNHYSRCERCDAWSETESLHTIYDENQNYDWCDSCYQHYSYFCDDCDESHTTYSCWRGNTIHSYSYTPDDLTFRWMNYDNMIQESTCELDANSKRGSHTFMGFEVEVEGGNLSDGAALFTDFSNYMYLKNDGSLNHGFEVVSHPSTLDVFHRMSEKHKLFDPFHKLGGINFSAWSTSTCGMHVHVSRRAFESKAHLWRFAWVFNCNPHNFEIFAGRSSSQWAKFRDQKTTASKIIAGKAKRYTIDRYTAVNLSNPDTVEIRIFRSSLLGRRIMSNLGLVDCVVEFTRNMTVKDVNEHKDSWGDFVRFVLSRPESKYETVQYYMRKYFKEIANTIDSGI